MTERQKARVDSIIYESQSLELFVTSQIRRQDGADLSTEEIVEAYSGFCNRHSWSVPTVKTIERRLVDLMLEHFNAPKNTHLRRNEVRVNGYQNVALASQE